MNRKVRKMFKAIENREALVDLYHRCFPDIVREEAVVRSLIFDQNDRILCIYEEETLCAACIVHGRAVTLLCVRPESRGKGYGNALLNEAERIIRENGYHTINVGVGTDDRYFMPGVPMNEGAEQFFIKRGYTHKWGDTECLDMDEDLSDFHYDTYAVGDNIHGITYRWAGREDLSGIRECVSDAQKSFVPYYMEEQHYEAGTKAPVLIAERSGQALGCLIVSLEVEGEGLGSVGCTATRTSERGQGIATNLVRLGTRYLKDSGMRRAFLGYTYTDIVRMYERAGYRICQRYFMATKDL